MKIEHSAYFLAMKDSSSLSEASAKAHISQQGYGKVIAALESALGCKLVERDARGAHLTSAGLLFMRHAEAMVAEFEKAKMDSQDAEGRPGHPARIRWQHGFQRRVHEHIRALLLI